MARALLGALAAVGIAVVLVLATSHGDDYKLNLVLDNANGLRQGAEVKVGGVVVGRVAHLDAGRDDRVHAELRLDREIGSGAGVEIRASNLIGSKFVAIVAGDPRRPLPSGTVIPPSRIATPVDLDQVLDVLDATTREQLLILLDQAGVGVLNRGADLRSVLGDLPADFTSLRTLLNRLNSQQRVLGDAVVQSDRFVARLTVERRELANLVDNAGATMDVVARRRRELRATLRRAPGALDAAHEVLARLRQTAEPLAPVARNLQEAAPALDRTLAALPAFTAAARPTLKRATAVAPLLTRLADHATPVVRQGLTAVQRLSTLATTAVPLTKALDVSVDDALGVVEAWARAIQTRDGIGHVFRGRVVVGTAVLSALQHIQLLEPQRGGQTRPHGSPSTAQKGSPATRPTGENKTPAPDVPLQQVKRVINNVKRTVDGLLNPKPQRASDRPAGKSLLNYLLG